MAVSVEPEKLMKYTISRQFSMRNEKFEVTGNSKSICLVKIAPSKEVKGQFNIKISNSLIKYVGGESCIVEPDSNNLQSYQIYIDHGTSDGRRLFGRFSYKFCDYEDYLYTIIIHDKLYNVRSTDLKHRRLAIVDTFYAQDPSTSDQHPRLVRPKTLLQVTEPISKATEAYHVTMLETDEPFGYLAIVLLLDLHER